MLTEIDLTIDPATRNVIDVSPRNLLVDRSNGAITAAVTAQPEVKDLVALYKTAVSPLANGVVGTITAAMSNSANAAGEMEAGDLIADAQLQGHPAGRPGRRGDRLHERRRRSQPGPSAMSPGRSFPTT